MAEIPGTNGGTTNGSGQGTTTEELKAKAQDAAKQARTKAQGAAQRIKQEGKQRLETGKDSAAQTAEQLADAVGRASDELHQQEQHGLADYASQVASGITTFADSLRNRSVDELIAETQAFARRNPTLFFLGSIGVGIALSRFMKASAQHTYDADYEERNLDVSYGAHSEWQTPDASQSIYGGQAGASSEATRARPGGTSLDTPEATNIPPGGAYP